MKRHLFHALILTCAAFTAPQLNAQEAENASSDTTAFGSRILTLTDVILQNHIDPPTRQEILLSGIKALYRADNRQVPTGLSGRVSELSKTDEFLELLSNLHSEFNKLKDMESVLTNGMFEAVPGETILFEVKEDKILEQIAANRYVGIGIVLAIEDKLPRVPKVLFDGPAWKAGMKHGDILVEINSESTADKELNTVLQELRGEEGSTVTVVVRQPDSEELRTLTMTRSRVFIPTIEGFREKTDGEWQYTVDNADDIGFIRVLTIGPSTVQELQQVQARLQQQNARGIIIDLREGGGIMHNVVMFADALLDGGVVGHVRTTQSVATYEARPEALFQGVPLVVLLSEHSQSDRVFLTAALQDHSRAIVVGEPTANETFVNSLLLVPGRVERIRLAIGVMQRGDGTPLVGLNEVQRRGGFQLPRADQPPPAEKRPGFVMPDHLVSMESATEQQPDPQLARAVDVIKGMGAQAAAQLGDAATEGT